VIVAIKIDGPQLFRDTIIKLFFYIMSCDQTYVEFFFF